MAGEAALAMRRAALRVSDGLQEAKSMYPTIEDAYADEQGPTGRAFLSYYESAIDALGTICNALDAYSRMDAPRNRRQVDSASGIAFTISYAAAAANSLRIGGCYIVSDKALELGRTFEGLSPRKARKLAHNYFLALHEQINIFEGHLQRFDLSADLQKKRRDRREDVYTLIEGIGAAAEHTSQY